MELRCFPPGQESFVPNTWRRFLSRDWIQTWEDPSQQHAETKAKGDNDPLDVCEIGEQVGYVGQIKQVKVLGIMALLDEGETDWKVIVVDVSDPLASKLNDVEDVERHLPGLIRATNEWFRIYKIPDGKPENQFAFSGEAKNKKYATEIIHECHEAWRRLVTGESPAKTASYDLSMCVFGLLILRFLHTDCETDVTFSHNITVQQSPGFLRRDDPRYTGLPLDSRKPPAPIDPSGECTHTISALIFILIIFLSVEMVPHRLCASVDGFHAFARCSKPGIEN